MFKGPYKTSKQTKKKKRTRLSDYFIMFGMDIRRTVKLFSFLFTVLFIYEYLPVFDIKHAVVVAILIYLIPCIIWVHIFIA